MKKIYTFFAILMFLATAGTAFAANPAIQLTGYTPVSNTEAKIEAFYSLGDAQSLDLYFYWDNICGVFSNQSPVYRVTNSSGYISYNVKVSQAGTYCYKVSGMKHMADGASDFIDSGSPSYKEFKTANSNNTVSAPSVQNTGATSVTNTSTLLNAYYTSGGATNSTVYFMYGPSSSGAIYKSNTINQSSTNGDVATTVTGLSTGTTYVYRAYITTSYGTVSASNTGTFTTTGGNNSANTCVINNFYADNSSVSYGSSTTLRWNTTNCTNASLSNFGTVSVSDSRSTGSIYSSTTYTLNVWGNNGSDSRSININVGSNNYYNNYPSCYYSNQCYWNGYSWIYYNNNNYQNNNVNTYSGTYPSCYYDATCYWTGSVWMYNNGGNVSGNYAPYTYNPHTPYTGGPNYVTRTISGGVKTVYVDQPVTAPVYYNGYDTNIMSRYNADYPNTSVRNGSLLTGSAGSAGQVTLIGLLIAIIIIMIIIYVVKSNSEKELN